MHFAASAARQLRQQDLSAFKVGVYLSTGFLPMKPNATIVSNRRASAAPSDMIRTSSPPYPDCLLRHTARVISTLNAACP